MTDALSISVNSTVSESLSDSDYYNPHTGYYYDSYEISGITPGASVTVALESNDFNTWVGILNTDTGEWVEWDENTGSGSNSSIDFIPTFGDENSYVIAVSSIESNSSGAYSLSINSVPEVTGMKF